MKVQSLLCAAAAAVMISPLAAQAPQGAPAPAAAPAAQVQAAPPIRVFIRAGLKTHAEGEHDYPQFLADWSKLLTARGAIVDGGLSFPSAEALAGIDVIVMYKGDAGYMTLQERMALEAFQKRGGGLVGLHDAICAEDPEWWAGVFGGAKKHGQVNYTLQANVPYTIVDKANPIMQGMNDFEITDESFYLMTWAKQPQINVLATAKIADTPSARQGAGHVGEDVPQIWTYERPNFGGQSSRAFVWMQGHNYSNISSATVQPMLLRAISWAAKRPVDALSTVQPQRGGGGRRGGGPGAPGGRGAGAGRGAANQ
jgi:type 1 glutamine amidotransferase